MISSSLMIDVKFLPSWLTAPTFTEDFIFEDYSRPMVRQPTFSSQQHKLQHENYKNLQSSILPLISTSFDVSLSARNYESLQAMVKSGHLLAASQRSSLEFIFKALVGMAESCHFDFLQSQSVSTMQQHNIDLLTAELAEKGPSSHNLVLCFFYHNTNY